MSAATTSYSNLAHQTNTYVRIPIPFLLRSTTTPCRYYPDETIVISTCDHCVQSELEDQIQVLRKLS